MYYILTFESGQPVILYNENEKIYMYTIMRGRIISKGILFSDIKSDFKILKGKPDRICYISINGKFKLITVYKQSFVETLSLPLENPNKNTKVECISPVLSNGELYIFYLHKNTVRKTSELYYLNASSIEKGKLLKDNLNASDTLYAFTLNNKIILTLENTTRTTFYYIDHNFNFIEVLNNNNCAISSLPVENEKSEISNLRYSLAQMTHQYNELSEYAGKLQEELRKRKFDLQ